MNNSLKCRFILLFFAVCSIPVTGNTSEQNQRYQNLKATLFSEPYNTLPNYRVHKKQFGKKGTSANNHLLTAAKRTLTSSADLINFPNQQKLIQANGICFSGEWHITEKNNYTGLFRHGASSPIIARASVALNGTLQKHKRAFGMAIKLLPEGLGSSPSLNVFVMHSMGGVIEKYMLDLAMDNQPKLGQLPKLSDLPTALRIRRDLRNAEKEINNSQANVTFRPVNHLAQHQTENTPYAPKWLRLRAKTDTRVDANDFREELKVQHYPSEQIIYHIDVAVDHPNGKSKANWQTIGELRLTKSVTSASCDQQLHFQHPKLMG